MIRIDVTEVTNEDRRSYGITHESPTVHRVTGRGTHNPHHPHRIRVWSNVNRPNTDPDKWNEYSGKPGPGKYRDPSNKGTNDPTTVLLSAEAVIITAEPDPNRPVYGEPLNMGDAVTLRFPDGTVSEYVLTARPLSDPCLMPTT